LDHSEIFSSSAAALENLDFSSSLSSFWSTFPAIKLVVLTTGKVLQKELNDEEKSRFSNAAAEELKISE
jgi:hypothetical protein